ncbi:hypothetical protein WUE2121_2163 [Neisseria meningitidis]|nr:hypothetical protein WUE2121_2163 [Neisseria meningitidis]
MAWRSCSAVDRFSGKTALRVSNRLLPFADKSICANSNRLSRKDAKSRGRALPTAMRAAMRSMSAMFFRRHWRGLYWLSSAATASWLARMWARLRKGWCSQRAKRRLPIWVAQRSSVDIRVGDFLPERVCVISRLRRVAASIPIYWLSVSSDRPSKCCGIRFCVRRI